MFDLTHLVQTAGYVGLFLIVFAESGLFFGFFLPGDSLLFTAGFLASQDYLNIGLLTPLLFVAAVLGDLVGYLFGKYTGPVIFSKPESLFFHPSHVDKTAEFFKKHGVKTIFFARFIPIVRTFAPIMAGVGGMKYETFFKYNVLGALVWAIGITWAGYFFGEVIPQADRFVIPIVILIIISSLFPPLWEYQRNKRQSSGHDSG